LVVVVLVLRGERRLRHANGGRVPPRRTRLGPAALLRYIICYDLQL
jgi:hypothetical protein